MYMYSTYSNRFYVCVTKRKKRNILKPSLTSCAGFIPIASGVRALAWLNKEQRKKRNNKLTLRFGWLLLCYLDLASG